MPMVPMGHQRYAEQEAGEKLQPKNCTKTSGRTRSKWNMVITPIAFSPDFILNNRFSFSHKGFEAALQSQYVSKQYMSNAKQAEQTLDAYFVSNLNLAYTFQLRHVKSVTVGFTIYNIFNEKYENNGYCRKRLYAEGRQARTL